MKDMTRSAWRGRLAPVACCGAVLVLALASGSASASASSGRRASASAGAAKCTAANVQVWLGLGVGGGTAGSTYYPLEFSNVGRHPCTLHGYPGVSAVANNGRQLGPPASRNGQRHGTVTLAAGATGHAILRVVDAGNVCSKPVTAAFMKVFAPGTTRSEPVPFSFAACARQGVLEIGPVRAGVGIPGYTTS